MKDQSKTKAQLISELEEMRLRVSELGQDEPERTQAEGELSANERLFQTLVEQSPFGIQVFDSDGMLRNANRAWEEIWGVPVEQVVGRFNALKDSQIKEAGLLPIIERSFAGESVTLPDSFFDPGISGMPGRERWIRTNAYPVKDANGSVLNVVVVNQDITGQKDAEKALHDSESRFRSLIEQSPISTVLYTPEGQPTFGNPASAKLWNMPPELVQQVYQSYNILDDHQLVAQGIMADIQKGFAGEYAETGPIKYDPSQTDSDYVGPARWLQAFIYPVKDGDEKIHEVVVMHADVTERVQAEQSLQESEATNRALLEAIPDAIFQLDRNGVFVSYIPARDFRPLLPINEFLGKTVEDTLPPFLARQTRSHLEQLLQTGEGQVYEYSLPTKKGTRYFEARQVKDSVDKVLAIVRDITERKRVVNALQEREKQLNIIYENVKEVIFTLNVEEGGKTFRFQSINPAFLETTGLKANQVVGKLVNEVIPEPSLSLVLSNYQRALQRKESVRWEEVTSYPSGNKVGDVNVTPIFDEQGNCTHLIGTVYDITERKLAETEREKLISELEAKNAELERFTYTVSHDLKAPLITINGFIGYLEDDATSGNMGRLRGDIQRIQGAVEKMQRLLDELLELSRIGRLMNPPETIPFEEIAREVLDNVHGQLEERGVAVTLSPNLPTVYGDRQRLVEVLQNLVDNAAKCMGEQPDPRIEIGQSGEEDGNQVFYVKDNGIGIAPEYHEKIFDLFEKLDSETEGTGVGLALVKRIVEFHGGRIWVESEAGIGATFYFTLEKGDEIS